MNMSRRRRSQAAIAAVAAGAFLLTACSSSSSSSSGGGAGSSGGKTEISFWDTNANTANTASWKKVISAFEAANPTITVDYSGLPSSSAVQKVDNAIVTKSMPDVLITGNDYSHYLAENALAPLETDLTSSGITSQLSPTMLKVARGNSRDGKLYEIPIMANSDTIWYRNDWLKAANLPAPTTWADYFKDQKAMTDASKNKFGISFRGGSGSMPQMFGFMYGVSGVSSFFDADHKATMNNPANVAAMQQFVNMYGSVSASGDLTNDYPKIVAAFDGGSAWSIYHNLGSYQSHVKALGAANVVGAQPFPNAQGITTATSPAISGLMIGANSAHHDAAWKFIQYVATDPTGAIADTQGQLPANLAAQKASWVTSSQPLSAVVTLAANPKTQYISLPVFLPDYSTMQSNKMEPDFQLVLTKKMTVQAFCDKYAALLTADYAKYLSK